MSRWILALAALTLFALLPLSATRFSWSGSILDFSIATSGARTLTIHYAEGSESGPRRK